MPKILAVIAKFKEDVSWATQLKCEYIIYDKSKDIPNIGREAETYLRFIIENYNNLPDYVIFLQGNPFDHLSVASVDYINYLIDNIHLIKDTRFLNNIFIEPHNNFTRTKESFEALFSNSLPPAFCFSTGAQYIVPKGNITCRSKEFYEIIRNLIIETDHKTSAMSNCLVCPWTLERMWPIIFNKNAIAREITRESLL